MSKYTLVLLTAGDCGACRAFKEERLGQVRSALNDFPDVSLSEISLEKMASPLPSKFAGLKSHIPWFPSAFLFKTSSLEGNAGDLHPTIFSKEDRGATLLDGENISRWLKMEIPNLDQQKAGGRGMEPRGNSKKGLDADICVLNVVSYH